MTSIVFPGQGSQKIGMGKDFNDNFKIANLAYQEIEDYTQINVRKIISMKEVINKPIEEVKIKIKNIDDIVKIKKLSLEAGNTNVVIDVEVDKKRMSFQLSEKRKIDHKMLNIMRNEENIDIL